MKRRTSLLLDTDLLAEAERILGTSKATEAIHLALAEVVNRDKRRRLAAIEIPELTPESLEQSRRGRQYDTGDSV